MSSSTGSRRSTDRPPPRTLRGAAELVQAIPYLLGFHPHRSLVLVGLRHGILDVTARVDLLPPGDPQAAAAGVVRRLVTAGCDSTLAVFFPDFPGGPAGPDSGGTVVVPGVEHAWYWRGAVAELAECHDRQGCRLLDVLVASRGRVRSLSGDTRGRAPDAGWLAVDAPSPFVAAATVDGTVAFADREELAAQFAPGPDRSRLAPLLHRAQATLAARESTPELRGADAESLIVAADVAGEPGWTPPGDEELARYAVLLRDIPVRDAVWTAVDDRRVTARQLFLEVARRCPPPYDAVALFLYGWSAWRAGDGTVASIAAERALISDPELTAADLLQAVLSRMIDPREFPRLSDRRRSAGSDAGVRRVRSRR